MGTPALFLSDQVGATAAQTPSESFSKVKSLRNESDKQR